MVTRSKTSKRTVQLEAVLHTACLLWAQPPLDMCCHLNSKVSLDTERDGLKFCGTRLGRQCTKGARFSSGWQRLYSNSFLARFVSTRAAIPIIEDSRVAPAAVVACFVRIIKSSRLKKGGRAGVTGPMVLRTKATGVETALFADLSLCRHLVLMTCDPFSASLLAWHDGWGSSFVGQSMLLAVWWPPFPSVPADLSLCRHLVLMTCDPFSASLLAWQDGWGSSFVWQGALFAVLEPTYPWVPMVYQGPF